MNKTVTKLGILSELSFIFSVQISRLIAAEYKLMDQLWGYTPSRKVLRDIRKARAENREAEWDLRNHFTK